MNLFLYKYFITSFGHLISFIDYQWSLIYIHTHHFFEFLLVCISNYLIYCFSTV